MYLQYVRSILTIKNQGIKQDQVIPKEKAVALRHMADQLLFMLEGEMIYIQTSVDFLTTHVKISGKGYWGKLKPLLTHLKGMEHMNHTLAVDYMYMARWRVDTS